MRSSGACRSVCAMGPPAAMTLKQRTIANVRIDSSGATGWGSARLVLILSGRAGAHRLLRRPDSGRMKRMRRLTVVLIVLVALVGCRLKEENSSAPGDIAAPPDVAAPPADAIRTP